MAAHTWKQQQQQKTKYRCHSATQGKGKKPQSVLVHKHLGAENGIIDKRLGEWVEINTITKDCSREEEERNKAETKLRTCLLKLNIMIGNKVKTKFQK